MLLSRLLLTARFLFDFRVSSRIHRVRCCGLERWLRILLRIFSADGPAELIVILSVLSALSMTLARSCLLFLQDGGLGASLPRTQRVEVRRCQEVGDALLNIVLSIIQVRLLLLFFLNLLCLR